MQLFVLDPAADLPQLVQRLDGQPFEYPIFERVNADGSTTPVHSFRGDLLAYEARLTENAADYAFSMVSMRVDLPSGNYRVRVLDALNNHDDATDFGGNFSITNHLGDEYINCTQYLSSEADNGLYDFDFNATHPMALGNGGINDVMADLSVSYSVRFLNQSSVTLPVQQDNISSPSLGLTDLRSYEFWFRTVSPEPGEIFQYGEVFRLIGQDNSGDLVLRLTEDNESPANLDNLRFRHRVQRENCGGFRQKPTEMSLPFITTAGIT